MMEFDLVHGVCQCIQSHVRFIHLIFNHLIISLVCFLILLNRVFLFLIFLLIKGIKRVYIGSQLIYAIGMLLMGYLRHRIAVIILSAVAGILYSTLFTIPYLLISKYYSSNTVCSYFLFKVKSFIY
jgi:hypothetical protein